MPDLTKELFGFCPDITNFRKEVPSSKGDSVYIVTCNSSNSGEYQYNWHCTCKGFEYHQKCKHVTDAEADACQFNELDCGRVEGSNCPECGKALEYLNVAV